MKKVIRTTLASVMLVWANVAYAGLIDIGDGLLYDDFLNVTWLQDANYMQSTGHPDGRVSWDMANAFGENLEYFYAAQNILLTEWRLPSAFDFGTTSVCTVGPCINSELGHLQFIDGFDLFTNFPSVVTHWTSPSFGSSAFGYNHASGNHFAIFKDPVFKPTSMFLMNGDARAIANPAPIPAPIWLFVSGIFIMVRHSRLFPSKKAHHLA
ncbi:MAG: hypothetical protein Hals2KO_05370 [Halioglobus sp.]